MIDISYNDGVKIETGQINKIFSAEQLPLKINIKNVISKEIVWSTDVNNFMWASYPNNEMVDVEILDAKGNFIYHYYWDVLNHGSIFYKSLWLYCKNLMNKGIKPNGLVIGTHDGEFGEWCPLVRYNLSDMLLVEASQKQFDKLVKNYSDKSGIRFLNELITTNGKDVEFFEGGRGYTNSVVERVIKSWETEKINKTTRKSVSINELISKHTGKLDWIHLDVEGLDAQLLMAMDESLLPNFIIFEDANLEPEEKSNLMKYLSERGYLSKSQDGICMSIR